MGNRRRIEESYTEVPLTHYETGHSLSNVELRVGINGLGEFRGNKPRIRTRLHTPW